MKYIIGQADIDWSDDRWENKGGYGSSPKRRKGYIGLWDRNMVKFIWFKIVKKCVDKYAYVVERKGWISAYWKNNLLKIK